MNVRQLNAARRVRNHVGSSESECINLWGVRVPLSAVKAGNTTHSLKTTLFAVAEPLHRRYTLITTEIGIFARHYESIRGENACYQELRPPVYKFEIVLLAATSR